MPAPCRARPRRVASFRCLKDDCWPVRRNPFSLLSFSLLVQPAAGKKQAPQIIWLHQQATGSSHSSSFASEPLLSIYILRDISALFPDPVTRLRYVDPVGCPHT